MRTELLTACGIGLVAARGSIKAETPKANASLERRRSLAVQHPATDRPPLRVPAPSPMPGRCALHL